MTVSTASPVITRSVTRRRRLIGATAVWTVAVSGMAPRRLAAGYGPHQQSGKRVHNNRDQKQSQSDFHQGREIGISGRFTEFVREHAGHGVTRREKRLSNLWPVANHHGHSH